MNKPFLEEEYCIFKDLQLKKELLEMNKITFLG